ncbi:MAG: hypothetical protein M0R03_03515 [Novosphingobium sp.]|nr:hypothetical protein [Novosphingobium sp.]
MTVVKLIGYIVALLAAGIFTFAFPGSGVEIFVVGLLSSIAAQFGITKWRVEYEQFKVWYQSKTLGGSLFVVIPLMAYQVIQFFGIEVPTWALPVIIGMVVAGGGQTIIGIIDAVRNK